MRLGIFPNLVKPQTAIVVDRLMALCDKLGIPFYLPSYVGESRQEIYRNIPKGNLLPYTTIYKTIDIAIVIGGDGTILKLARQMTAENVPICGVNMGTLGFLFEVEVQALEDRLRDLLAGHYFIEERMMLHSELWYGKGMVQQLPEAVNEIVVAHGNVGKMVRLDMSINGQYVQQYPGDGIVIATSTGSTGYNFSSGGPVVSPKVHCIMITPICPHLLLKLPLILGEDDTVEITAAHSRDMVRLSVDGLSDQELMRTMTLRISKSKRRLQLVRFDENYFYRNLFTKMMGK